MTSKHIDLAAKHLSVARMIAETYSKDPSTKVGAMVLGSDGETAEKAGRFVRGADDSPYLYANREVKYRHIVHAEMNAIANAARVGAKLKGAVWYVTECPCDNVLARFYKPTRMQRRDTVISLPKTLCLDGVIQLNLPLTCART